MAANLIPLIKNLRAAFTACADDKHGAPLPTDLIDSLNVAIAVTEYYAPFDLNDQMREKRPLRLFDHTKCWACGKTLEVPGLLVCNVECYEAHAADMRRLAEVRRLEGEVRLAEAQVRSAETRVKWLQAEIKDVRGY